MVVNCIWLPEAVFRSDVSLGTWKIWNFRITFLVTWDNLPFSVSSFEALKIFFPCSGWTWMHCIELVWREWTSLFMFMIRAEWWYLSSFCVMSGLGFFFCIHYSVLLLFSSYSLVLYWTDATFSHRSFIDLLTWSCIFSHWIFVFCFLNELVCGCWNSPAFLAWNPCILFPHLSETMSWKVVWIFFPMLIFFLLPSACFVSQNKAALCDDFLIFLFMFLAIFSVED